MLDKRRLKFMEKLERCYKVVQQSSSKGIRAVEVAEKLGIHRTTAHDYLNTLELMGRVYNQHGLWFAKEPADIKPIVVNVLAEIKEETEKIKEDYVKGNIKEADRRLFLLIYSKLSNIKLPENLKKEIKELINEYNEKLKVSIREILFLDKKAMHERELRVAEEMIPKFLKVIEKLYIKQEKEE